jgi:anthranilate phosphoribosyltransferase
VGQTGDVSKVLMAVAALVAAVGGFVVAVWGDSPDSSSRGVTIVLREVGDYERFLDDNPSHWRE